MNISIGTITLEVNRWSTRKPSYKVSEWINKIQNVGFDGLELWENHVLLAEGEAERIKASGFPINVYNTYADFTNDPEEAKKRAKAVEMIHYLNAGAVKYNIGNTPELFDEYKENVQRFAEDLPKGCVLLNELHDDTLMETNETALRFFEGLCPEKFAIVLHPFGTLENLQAKFDAFGKRITHIHSQCSHDNTRVRLDRVPEHICKCFEIMKKSGFAGNFTVEFTELTATPGENINDLFANAVKDMEFIRGNYV